MSRNSILVEADYGKQSVWIVTDNIELTEEETELLSTTLWKYKYQINFELWVRSFRKPHKQWEFIINNDNFLDTVAKRLVEIVKDTFPDKLVEFFEVNKYE